MREEISGLILRAHDRRGCDIAAKVVVGPRDAGRVVLSGAATGSGDALDCRVVDFSDGGLGLRARVFLPVGCELDIRIGAPGSTPASTPGLEIRGAVRRAQMIGRGPEYYLGVAFTEQSSTSAAGLARLAGAVGVAPGPEVAGA